MDQSHSPHRPELAAILKRYDALAGHLDEKSLRLYVASEARSLGRGGIEAVAQVTGYARSTLGRGLKDLNATQAELPRDRIRRKGGGRKTVEVRQPGLRETLQDIIASAIRGDPEAALLWVSRSQRHLVEALNAKGFRVTQRTVGRMLKTMGYSTQANAKTKEGGKHPDRNAQFEYINALIKEFQAANQPVISVDTKKKENIGDFKNNGRTLRPKGAPEPVRVHDFLIKDKGKVAPYGVYDVTANEGWVNVGVDHDTAAFAVESIRRWWNKLGKRRYADKAKRLLITADCGGSNGARVRLWKIELQKLANETGLCITVAHHPPGTSKWNRIEHKMFSFISTNWAGRPLVSHQVVTQLIASTTTKTGLKIFCDLDENVYEKGIKIPKAALNNLTIAYNDFHGDWNYTISPVIPLP
jgi:Rhodopirellula transposase DDE domain/Arginine repressor, DNA binding domain